MSVVFAWYKLKAFLSVFCIKGAPINKSEKDEKVLSMLLKTGNTFLLF